MMSNQSQPNQNESNQNQVKHVPAGTGPAYCGPGDRITFLITDGARAVKAIRDLGPASHH